MSFVPVPIVVLVLLCLITLRIVRFVRNPSRGTTNVLTRKHGATIYCPLSNRVENFLVICDISKLANMTLFDPVCNTKDLCFHITQYMYLCVAEDNCEFLSVHVA